MAEPVPLSPSAAIKGSVHRLSYGSSIRNRLPTLQEVLTRKTRPPVDLYCFYLFLQRERAEDALDFWLDAQQHENLCRAYFKDLRRSNVELSEAWPAYYEKARTRGSVYNGVTGISKEHKSSSPEKSRRRSTSFSQTGHVHDDPSQSRAGSGLSGIARTTSPSPHGQASSANDHLSPTMRALFPNEEKVNEHARRRSDVGGRGATAQPVIPRSSAITQIDLIASAERIYYRYLLTGADKEIYLPPQLRIHYFPLNSARLAPDGADEHEEESQFMAEVPDLFVAQKEYVYRSMEQDSFPRFLRAKAFGNLTPLSALVRLSIGLIAFWAALSTAFALIFLDVRPRKTRFWIIIPLTVATLCVVSHFYDVDPLLIAFNRSETTPFRTLVIREKFVQKILRARAAWVTLLSMIIITVICVLFISVPGHRL